MCPVITSYIFIITNFIVRQNFGALLSHKVTYNLNFFNFRHKLVHVIYKHYKFTELRPTYSNTLVCLKMFHFIKFISKIPIDVFGICEKISQGGRQFHSSPPGAKLSSYATGNVRNVINLGPPKIPPTNLMRPVEFKGLPTSCLDTS